MKKVFAATVGLAALAFAANASAAPWSKAYVFDFFEPAMYYGSDEGDAGPGTDCPLGTLPDNDWKKMLRTSWRTDEQVAKIMNPEGPSRQRDGGFRGPAPDISIYAQPWTAPDPGLFEVVGDLAYGFNLDGNEKSGFKASVDGRYKGVDNAYYKAIGCVGSWRGPSRKGHHAEYVMEGMRNGQFAVLMVVSGDGPDPANDPSASLAFYTSLDKVVKDANGQVAAGYTFRVNPAGLQHTVPVKTVGGSIETRAPAFINIRSVDNVPMKIEKGQLRFDIGADGSLQGFIGGYRDINDLYGELSGGGATFELTMRMNTPSVWYSLQRNIDYTAPDGRKMLSMAYRYYAVPAHVVTPDAKAVVNVAKLIEAPAGMPAQAPTMRGRAPAAAAAAPAASVPAPQPAAALDPAKAPTVTRTAQN